MDNLTYQQKALRSESNDFDGIRERLKEEKTIRMLHAAIGLATEAGEALDALKKHIFYGKNLDTVNLSEETGDSQWYAALMADALSTTLEDIQATNIEKLEARYKKNVFSTEEAYSRDLNKEREILNRRAPIQML